MNYNHVHTIKDIIYIQYSIILARERFNIPDGIQIQYHHRGYVKSIFMGLLKSGKKWSEIIGEIENNDKELKCAYCGKESDKLLNEPIIPITPKIKEKFISRGVEVEPGNFVNVCTECNKLRNELGLYEFFKKKMPDNIFYYQNIPIKLEKKYLRAIYYFHEFSNTLNKEDLDGDKDLTVLDIDFILH